MQISVFYLCYMYLFFIASKHFVLLLRNSDKKEDRQNELKAFTKMYLFKKKNHMGKHYMPLFEKSLACH